MEPDRGVTHFIGPSTNYGIYRRRLSPPGSIKGLWILVQTMSTVPGIRDPLLRHGETDRRHQVLTVIIVGECVGHKTRSMTNGYI